MATVSEKTLVLLRVIEKIFFEIKPISFPKIRSVTGNCSFVILNGKGMKMINSNAKQEATVLITLLFMQWIWL